MDDQAQKVVMLGTAGSGKTSIVLTLREQPFNSMVAPTVGAAYHTMEFSTKKGSVHLKIWDTAGEERYRTFTGLYSQNARAAIIVFDITHRQSYEELDSWIDLFRKGCHLDAKIYIVGNKIDLSSERDVTRDEAEQFAFRNDMVYFETSAKTGEGVELLFKTVAMDIAGVPKQQANIAISKDDDSRKGECC